MNPVSVIQARLKIPRNEAMRHSLVLLAICILLIAVAAFFFCFIPYEATKEQQTQLLSGDYKLVLSPEAELLEEEAIELDDYGEEKFLGLSTSADENTVYVYSERGDINYVFTISGIPFIHSQDTSYAFFYNPENNSLQLKGNTLVRDLHPDWPLYGVAWALLVVMTIVLMCVLLPMVPLLKGRPK